MSNNQLNIQSTILGFPRMGKDRELKKALESYWKGASSQESLISTGKQLRESHWSIQKNAGLSEFPVNDFSYYDHVLDLSLALGAIPERYNAIPKDDTLRLYFAMARGEKGDSSSVTAMEMSKWYDTNYHYIVPELHKNMKFSLSQNLKVITEIEEAQVHLGQEAAIRPVLLGPISYLALSKTTDDSDALALLDTLLPTYVELLKAIQSTGVSCVQIDEPHLVTDLSESVKQAYTRTFEYISKELPSLQVMLTSYFDKLYENAQLIASLPVHTVHVDLVRGDASAIAPIAQSGKHISLGLINGRNIWKADLATLITNAQDIIAQYGTDATSWYINSSCSLLHCPVDVSVETELGQDIQSWLSFAVQKIEEITLISKSLQGEEDTHALESNAQAIKSRKESGKVHKSEVKQRVSAITPDMAQRKNPYSIRKEIQKEVLALPLYPTTTIGSFPQTSDIRKTRAAYKNNRISKEEYTNVMKEEITKVVRFQEEVGLDVLVHGEPERNDMVEYFGENFDGFIATKNGWVQSYGSRCVKPPIIYGDLTRDQAITVDWTTYAQSLTNKPMKGMLTGPVTILQWSFVRDDQPRKETTMQIALLIRDEVQDLERAGIKVIQVDEPAIREGLPLRTRDHNNYLSWAIETFKIATCGVEDSTQMHTHMCYSEFNEIIDAIAALDADVISIEASRSRMELLEVFKNFNYPNDIGPGVYDIHSPRIPSVDEMLNLMNYAQEYIDNALLWVNPDCGLKTRQWDEVKPSLLHMVEVAKKLRNI